MTSIPGIRVNLIAQTHDSVPYVTIARGSFSSMRVNMHELTDLANELIDIQENNETTVATAREPETPEASNLHRQHG